MRIASKTSLQEIVGILALILFSAAYVFANPESLGLRETARELTVRMVRSERHAGLKALCAKRAYPVSCVKRLLNQARRSRTAVPSINPIRAGEQMRSTPVIAPLSAPAGRELCGNACATRANEPTESWEEMTVPGIATVAVHPAD